MGMPGVSISFTEVAATAVKRGERGIVAMIVRDVVPDKNPVEILTVTDVPTTFSDENKKQVELALMGYMNTPKKVIVYVADTSIQEQELGLLELRETALDNLLKELVGEDK